MIIINVSRDNEVVDLIDPVEMINSPEGTVFQQYFNNKPTNQYYISCGVNEESLVQIWYDDEDGKHRLSTENKKSLKKLYDTVKVKKTDAVIEINLT